MAKTESSSENIIRQFIEYFLRFSAFPQPRSAYEASIERSECEEKCPYVRSSRTSISMLWTFNIGTELGPLAMQYETNLRVCCPCHDSHRCNGLGCQEDGCRADEIWVQKQTKHGEYHSEPEPCILALWEVFSSLSLAVSGHESMPALSAPIESQ